MLKLFKIACLMAKKRTAKGVSENDIELFEQWIFPQNIMAICPLHEDDKLPNAECLIVMADDHAFQTTESITDLVERINEAVKE